MPDRLVHSWQVLSEVIARLKDIALATNTCLRGGKRDGGVARTAMGFGEPEGETAKKVTLVVVHRRRFTKAFAQVVRFCLMESRRGYDPK